MKEWMSQEDLGLCAEGKRACLQGRAPAHFLRDPPSGGRSGQEAGSACPELWWQDDSPRPAVRMLRTRQCPQPP